MTHSIELSSATFAICAVAMCCDDWDGAQGYGNLKTQSTSGSTTRSRVRGLHESGRSPDQPLRFLPAAEATPMVRDSVTWEAWVG
jgi:hypothetical protein